MGSAVLGRLGCELVEVDYCIASSTPAFFGREKMSCLKCEAFKTT